MLLSSLSDMVRNAESRKTRFLIYYIPFFQNNQAPDSLFSHQKIVFYLQTKETKSYAQTFHRSIEI